MTLRLVSDNSNVEDLPVGNVRDIAAMTRHLADDLEAEVHGEVVSLVTLLVKPDGIAIMWWGEDCSPYELMGLFEAAKLRVFADEAIDD